MSRRGTITGILSIVVLLFAIATAGAQKQKQAETPDQKSRKTKREDNRALLDWPKQDVKLIITADEQKAYDKLQTNEERENFIGDFWHRRDPTPDTEENEYREQYYERVTYANEHFGSGKAGWLTDRGRIYVKWGKPDEVESHPAGGTVQRTGYAEGSATTYPFETWFYRNLNGVGSGVEVEFVDPTSTGEYRIARNPFEKEVAGFGNGPSPEDTGGYGVRNYMRQKDSPFEWLELNAKLDAQPPVANSLGRGHGQDTPLIEDNVLALEIKPYFFFQSDGKVITAFTIQTDNRELAFQDIGGLQTAKLNIFGKILTVTQRKLGAFEETVSTTATVAELNEAKERKSVYGKSLLLAPGKYRLDVMVRDVVSGAVGFQQMAFTVPQLEATKLQISSIVLAAKLESLKDQVGGNQFSIGLTKVVPNVTATYKRGAPVGVYLQVYNAGIDQTTLRPAVDVDYLLLKDGKEVSKQVEDWTGLSDAGQRLTLARLLDTRDLTAGEYEIQIRIRDHVTGQTLSPAAKFTVIP
jgi:GWxTD domain-containing protein